MQSAQDILCCTACQLRGSSQTADWIDCAVCGNRYGSFLPSCPTCGGQNSFASPPAPKKSAASKIAVTAIVAIAVVVVVMALPALINIAVHQQDNPVITILQPQSQKPKSVAREELVQHVLDAINKDRADFGLPPVELSSNDAAQFHAEDVFKTKQISHWTTGGEKPYMTYTRYGGEGSVQQNVAIAGFTAEQYKQCQTNILLDCEKIDPLSTIDELEYEMMYKDSECCNDGHKNNILNAHHTHVSIGIVYDQYYLALVQNFENDYGLQVAVDGGQVKVSGTLLAGTLDHIAIYYDEMPTPQVYEQNKHLLSYSAGELVATVVKPLPPGYYYEPPEGYSLIEASRWAAEGKSVNVTFNLASAVKDDGVYTLFATVKDGEEMFEITSHSIFVDSENSKER
jgi:uncharacterized protein YkwD